MIAATVVALQPGFLADLWTVRDWLAHWSAGGHPYDGTFAAVDYPPNAFVLLWPLRGLSDSTLTALFIPMAVGATAVATWLMSGWLGARLHITLSTSERLVLVAMMLAGSSLRGAIWRGQLGPMAFLFGAIALNLAGRRRHWSSVALALCAFKPHVAIGFALAIFVTEGAAVVMTAAAIVGVMTGVFGVLIHQPLTAVLRMYESSLMQIYSGPDRVRGLLSIRWVIEDAVGSYDAGTLIWLVAALMSGAVLLDAALATRCSIRRTQVAVAFLVGTLIFLPHQLYHGWMVAPALWLMMWPEGGLISNVRVRCFIVAGFVLFGVLDVPRLLRLAFDLDLHWVLGGISYAGPPLGLTALFALLLWAVTRPDAVPKLGRV